MTAAVLEDLRHDPHALAELNRRLETQSAEDRVSWALAHLPAVHVLSTSFGIQSAVALHMVTHQAPRLSVIFIDTGYHFPETYRFADQLSARLQLDLKIYRPALTPAWQEVRFGRLWEQGVDGIRRYNRLNKVEPMRRALSELQARTWFTGLRRVQTRSRQNLALLAWRETRWKFAPLADWSDRDVWRYLKTHALPYHPLWGRGYVSIGDVHTTRPLTRGLSAEDTRFFGLVRECGLHVEL
jgi:phosphoadenosine phosphosulfate reductase